MVRIDARCAAVQRVHLIQTFGEQSIELTDTVIAVRMTVLGDSNPHTPYSSPKP